jgi:hypothetical protein
MTFLTFCDSSRNLNSDRSSLTLRCGVGGFNSFAHGLPRYIFLVICLDTYEPTVQIAWILFWILNHLARREWSRCLFYLSLAVHRQGIDTCVRRSMR